VSVSLELQEGAYPHILQIVGFGENFLVVWEENLWQDDQDSNIPHFALISNEGEILLTQELTEFSVATQTTQIVAGTEKHPLLNVHSALILVMFAEGEQAIPLLIGVNIDSQNPSDSTLTQPFEFETGGKLPASHATLTTLSAYQERMLLVLPNAEAVGNDGQTTPLYMSMYIGEAGLPNIEPIILAQPVAEGLTGISNYWDVSAVGQDTGFVVVMSGQSATLAQVGLPGTNQPNPIQITPPGPQGSIGEIKTSTNPVNPSMGIAVASGDSVYYGAYNSETKELVPLSLLTNASQPGSWIKSLSMTTTQNEHIASWVEQENAANGGPGQSEVTNLLLRAFALDGTSSQAVSQTVATVDSGWENFTGIGSNKSRVGMAWIEQPSTEPSDEQPPTEPSDEQPGQPPVLHVQISNPLCIP